LILGRQALGPVHQGLLIGAVPCPLQGQLADLGELGELGRQRSLGVLGRQLGLGLFLPTGAVGLLDEGKRLFDNGC
jgi:hypothetical protein